MPISTAIKTALAAGTFLPATLIRVTAKASQGGDEVAFALHTRDVVYDGSTFMAAPFEPSKMSQASGTQADNATIDHILADVFSKANIKGRKWDGARIELMCMDLNQLSEGPARKHIGRVGDITSTGGQAQTEFRGLMHLLNKEQGDRSSRRCRYQLGDEDCTLDLEDFTFSGTVVSIVNQQKFTISVSQADSYFKYGRIIWTSGPNDGLEMEVIDNDGQEIVLFLPMPGTVQIGNAFDIIAGDDKTLLTCHNKFDNAINHGGEDSMPNRDQLFTFPQ